MIHYGITDNIGIFNLCELRCTKNDNFTRDRDKVTCKDCLKLIPLIEIERS